jgi:hypothetical protein
MTLPESQAASSQEPPDSLLLLGEALKASCVELLAEYGLDAQPSTASLGPSDAPVSLLVAGVDFRGRELRGTVALWAAQSVIAETTRAAPGMKGDEHDLADWTCELANQLIGRMKNKLRAYDVALSLNVPRLILGPGREELERGIRYRFSCDFGSIAASLDVLIAPGFVLKERVIEESLVHEGEFTLL